MENNNDQKWKLADVLANFTKSQLQKQQEIAIREEMKQRMMNAQAQNLAQFVPGVQPAPQEQGFPQDFATAKEGGIHIDPSKRGTFKAQATRMGMGVQEAARHILANKDKYSSKMVKKANFARNFAKEEGGEMFDTEDLKKKNGGNAGLVSSVKKETKPPTKLKAFGEELKKYEAALEKWLGNPMDKAQNQNHKLMFSKKPGETNFLINPLNHEDPSDNIRHASAGYYTSKAIADKFPKAMQYTGIPQITGAIGSTLLGLGHELSSNKYVSDDYDPAYTKKNVIREAIEDAGNNGAGAFMNMVPFLDEQENLNFIKYLSDNNILADGIDDPEGKINLYWKDKKGNVKKPFSKQDGGELTEYGPGGSKKKEPIYVTDKNDPRLLAYTDSLNLYNLSQKQLDAHQAYYTKLNEILKSGEATTENYNTFPALQPYNTNLKKAINDKYSYIKKSSVENKANEKVPSYTYDPGEDSYLGMAFLNAYKKPTNPVMLSPIGVPYRKYAEGVAAVKAKDGKKEPETPYPLHGVNYTSKPVDQKKNGGELDEYKSGGYTVRRSSDRKGKTHVVIGPDGTEKYFGDPGMGERSKSKYGKEAFYKRHAQNLKDNPYFRAYARATWEEGGEIENEDYENEENENEDYEMVSGIADILQQVKDIENRRQIAKNMIEDFEEEDVDYNLQKFMDMAKLKRGGEMIRRADGSYSQRGLWDNIRANKGSGKAPTKEMLAQERKIKRKKYNEGGTLPSCEEGYYWNPDKQSCEPIPNYSNLNEDQKFLIDMANSPLFKGRYARMTGQPEEKPIPLKQDEITSYDVPYSADAYRKSIIDNTSTVRYAPVGVGDFSAGSDGLTASAYYLPKESSAFNEKLLTLSKFSKQALKNTKSGIDNQHTIFTNKDHGPYTQTHETSHASTLGRLSPVNPYLAKFEVPKSYNKEWATWAKEQYDNENFRNYILDPTEVKARKDAAAKYLMDNNLYDPIKNEFGEKEYNLLLQSDEKNALDLINNFPKEEVIRMFNEIVQNKFGKTNDMAKRGGQLGRFLL